MVLKRINPNAVLYHFFQKSVSEYTLFDDEMDYPVSYGSKNLVEGTIRKLDKAVTVIYYKRDLTDAMSHNQSFRRINGPRGVYTGKKQTDEQKKD
jgi:hypothetical protein